MPILLFYFWEISRLSNCSTNFLVCINDIVSSLANNFEVAELIFVSIIFCNSWMFFYRYACICCWEIKIWCWSGNEHHSYLIWMKYELPCSLVLMNVMNIGLKFSWTAKLNFLYWYIELYFTFWNRKQWILGYPHFCSLYCAIYIRDPYWRPRQISF